MTHELLWSVLAANEMNATLAGPALRDAATDLTRAVRFENTTSPTGPLIIWPIDTAGERIVGAAMMIDPDLGDTCDHTRAWSAGARCLLVSGAVVGDVSLATAAARARAAGATRVTAAVLLGWTGTIAGLDTLTSLSDTQAQVA